MSQEDAVYSSAIHRDDGSTPRNGRADLAGRVNGNGTRSTIQFDLPRLSTIHNNRDQEKSRQKEEQLAVV